VVRLHVRLEDRDDRGADRLCGREVLVDERLVRIDDREHRGRGAADEIARAGAVGVQERAQDHVSSVGPNAPSD
jgi:hypothetical protein